MTNKKQTAEDFLTPEQRRENLIAKAYRRQGAITALELAVDQFRKIPQQKLWTDEIVTELRVMCNEYLTGGKEVE